MDKLNGIYRKRLNRMREDINRYIESWLSMKEQKLLTSHEAVNEIKTSSVMDKFLNIMKLNDGEDEDYFDEDNFYEEVENNKIKKKKLSTVVPARRAENSLDKVLENKEESFTKILLRMIDAKGLQDADVYKRANVDRRLFSKIRADKGYVPSKKTVISLCLALQLELKEAEELLKTAGYALSASSRFDLIIMYLIENKEYNIHFANIVLDDYGEGTLSR